VARSIGTGLLVRVTHSSGLLEGNYTSETTFGPNDHRRHRPRQWLLDGLRKIEQLDFLTNGTNRTLGQAALKWLLADPAVASTLPNIYDAEQLREFAAAPEAADLTQSELDHVAELFRAGFNLAPAAGTARS
jgi:aryl-alcohol dehydrogenase-like predicted oxidoreductase